MDTLWIVLTQIALLHTVRVKSATVSAGDDKPGRLGDSHNVSITCTYKLDTDESADTMTIQRRKVTEGSFSNIASFNILAGTSSNADADLIDRADLILLEGSVTIRLNNILCDDAAIYRCIFQYNKNQILYPIESSMVLTIEAEPKDKPTFKSGNPNERPFIEEEILQLKCGGDVGLPAGNLLWFGYKGDNIVDLTSKAVEAPPVQSATGLRYCTFTRESTLTLNLTRYYNEFSFRCSVNQSLKIAIPDGTCVETSCVQTQRIIVHYPVRLREIYISKNPPGNTNVGSTVTLQCIVEGNPFPDFRWVKEGRVSMTMIGSEWRLTDLEQSDTGTYTCHASNIVNGTSYSVSQSINITVGCKDGSYGQDCTKKCGMCDGVCDSVDGSCPAGCLEGYNGTWCDVALPSKDIPEKDQLCTCVAAIVGAAIGSIVLVVLLGVGIIVCLKRQGRLKWVQSPEQKEPVHLSQQHSTQLSSIDTRREVFGHAHVYNNDYAVMDSNTIADNKEYDVIQHKQYQNI